MERDVATLALEAKKLAEFALAIWAGLRPHGCQWKESFSSLFYFIDVLACKPFAMQLDRCWHGDGARSIDANGELTSAMAARIGSGDLETSWKRSTGRGSSRAPRHPLHRARSDPSSQAVATLRDAALCRIRADP
jgi:hypothetical protein